MCYSFVPPRTKLSEQWLAQLRDTVAERDDIAAVYFLTALHEVDDGVVAQDEIHVELVEPPEYAAEPEQFRAYALVLPPSGPIWTLSPSRILTAVREVGERVA